MKTTTLTNLKAITNATITTKEVSYLAYLGKAPLENTIADILEVRLDSILELEICAGCGSSHTTMSPLDPGSHYHQVLLSTCKNCWDALGHPLFDEPEEDERQRIDEYFAKHGITPNVEEDYEEYVDLDKEKWDNYWGDFNQCGVHINWN